jgi:hypothetical protein
MATDADLFRIENGFWFSGREHFLAHLDETCLLAFPQSGEMHGVFSRESIADTATEPDRWRDVRMTETHVLRPAGDVAVLSYRADATRRDGQPYRALILSGYVRRAGGWKLAFHQHAPIA